MGEAPKPNRISLTGEAIQSTTQHGPGGGARKKKDAERSEWDGTKFRTSKTTDREIK